MNESLHCFGRNNALVGVMTEPEESKGRHDAPVVLWLNAGLLHSVGPYGWYVTLARKLAQRGISSFRFDLSGVGDSIARYDGTDNLEGGIADVEEAIHYLIRERGIQRYVLLGLCSGAVLAHHVAFRDERVIGAVFLDGCGYRTTGYYLRAYTWRVLSWKSWVRAFRKVTSRIANRQTATVGVNSMQDRRLRVEQYYLQFPALNVAQQQLSHIIRRGCRLLFLFSGGADRYFNHRRQFTEMYGKLDVSRLVDVHYRPNADHLYSGQLARTEMFSVVEDWIQTFC